MDMDMDEDMDMDKLIFHLRKLTRINRQILSELHKDEASITTIREAFEKRASHTRDIGDLIPAIDTDTLTGEKSNIIQNLFDQFGRQAEQIQDALEQVLDSSREKLGNAVMRRKAEEGYKALK